MKIIQTSLCSSKKYPYSPTEGIGISWGVVGPVKPKNLKKSMKLTWNFQRGGGVLKKIPSVGEVWIFSGITHFTKTPSAFPAHALSSKTSSKTEGTYTVVDMHSISLGCPQKRRWEV